MLTDILGYALAGGLIIAAVAILYLPILLLLKKRVTVTRQLSCVALGGTVFVILSATLLLDLVFALGAGLPQYRMLNLVPLGWLWEEWDMGMHKAVGQVFANMVMFVPYGFLLPVVFPRLRMLQNTVLCAALTSFGIEFIQYFIGRSADIDDLLQNTIGGAVGFLLYLLVGKLLHNTRFWNKALKNSEPCGT